MTITQLSPDHPIERYSAKLPAEPLLTSAIYHKNPYVRKATTLLLAIPRAGARLRVNRDGPTPRPAVLANSFPKSGTHLLTQIIGALPEMREYGAFLSSMSSSLRFRERSATNTLAWIDSFVPGEIVRGHLFFDKDYEEALQGTVHYFVYRDPRDVVVSEAYYLRYMNPWHRLSPYFRTLSQSQAISLAIGGLAGDAPHAADYPDIGRRFARYNGWVNSPSTYAVKFESLRSEGWEKTVHRMIDFYAGRVGSDLDFDQAYSRALARIRPPRSHTFRKGEVGGWRTAFTVKHRDEFKAVAGSLLVALEYERDLNW